jgi:hydroxypyruvate reductase
MSQRVTLANVARDILWPLDGYRLVKAAIADRYDEVWAVGKAATRMAWGSGIQRGLIITKHFEAIDDLEVLEAGHPIPDERGVLATRKLLARARAATGKILLCISGGTSALLAATVDGVTLEQLRAATRKLLEGGAPIGEINVIRRHVGAALGGRLAAATRAQLDVFAVSDVAGDDPAAIGSGPASPDPSTLEEAKAIAKKYSVDIPLEHETVKRVDNVRYRILANPFSLRDEAARRFPQARVRETLVTGPVEAIAEELAALELQPGETYIAVGEPTVKVSGNGLGGRAQHLALSMARAISGRDLTFVALGSDGSDGPTEAAGAAVDGSTWNPSGQAALENFDSHTWLSSVGATVVTGPTGTNLTDLLLLARRA